MADPVIAPTSAPPRAAWDQQPGENDLWFARFLRFVALGPGRSVSLVATGRRNAYPVPAHWPIQAKQRLWRERARAFDEAARADSGLVLCLNALLLTLATDSTLANGEAVALEKAAKEGYQVPPTEDEEYNGSRHSISP
jgi:hypothetical protein